MYTHPQQGAKENAAKHRKEMGAWLKKRREQLEMTQRDVAQAAGFDYYTMISQIEGGKTRIPPERGMDMARALKVSPEEMGKRMLRCYDPLLFKMIFSSKGDK